MNHCTHFTLKEREILKHFIDIGKNQTEISILLGKINRLYQEKSKEIVKMASTYLVKPMTDIKIDALIVNQEKS